MMVDVPILISVLGLFVSIMVFLTSSRRNKKTDDQREASEMTTLIVKLENIGNGVNEIKSDITPENLESFRIYYPDNETADEPDEQLEGVSNKLFETFSLVGDWEDKEIELQKETSKTPAVYGRQLSVTLGERLASDT